MNIQALVGESLANNQAIEAQIMHVGLLEGSLVVASVVLVTFGAAAMDQRRKNKSATPEADQPPKDQTDN